MRIPVILTIAAFLSPVGIAPTSAHAAGLRTPAATHAFLAAKTKKRKKTTVKKNTGEYLKAAPGTGPSGPAAK